MVAGSMVDCGGEEGGGERGQALCLRERSPRQMNLERAVLTTILTILALGRETACSHPHVYIPRKYIII